MTTKESSFIQTILDFFCSLKLTMFTLITLAITSIIGTVIPQGSIPPEYLHSISPNKLKLYQGLGFFDMYHSWWFILLLSLLSLNLIACSIKRLPAIWKTITRPLLKLDDSFAKTFSNTTTIKADGDAGTISEKVASFIKTGFADPVMTAEGGTIHLFAQRNPWSRLAVYCVHLSVLIIFIGAIIGSLFGYKGFVNIPEGQGIDTVMSRSDKPIPLGFSVHLEKFTVTNYPGGAPKEFKSILTVLENGQTVAGFNRVPVIVNDPLSYKGITFYQSSYGRTGEHEFIISDPDGSNPVPLKIESGGSTKLPDGTGFCLQETTTDISEYQPGLKGPAAQVEVHLKNGSNKTFIIYSDNPAKNRMNLPYTGGKLIQYKGGEEVMYTGLQVAKDPGVWIVWTGCILMMAGIYVTFFISHRRIWVRIENGTVLLCGNSSKNQAGFQIFMEQLSTGLKSSLNPEDRK